MSGASVGRVDHVRWPSKSPIAKPQPWQFSGPLRLLPIGTTQLSDTIPAAIRRGDRIRFSRRSGNRASGRGTPDGLPNADGKNTMRMHPRHLRTCWNSGRRAWPTCDCFRATWRLDGTPRFPHRGLAHPRATRVPRDGDRTVAGAFRTQTDRIVDRSCEAQQGRGGVLDPFTECLVHSPE